MFFNIYNLVFFFFRFFFKFFFFLKYLTPFLYSKVSNFVNRRLVLNKFTSVKKIKFNNLLTNDLNNFSLMYKTLLLSSSNLNTILVKFCVFKKIYHQNNRKVNFKDFTLTLVYIILTNRWFLNTRLITSCNFFSYQKINQLINNLSVKSRVNYLSYKFKDLINVHIIKINKNIEEIPQVVVNKYFKGWLIKFNSSSIDRLLSLKQTYNILFIRNFKAFNKGRYSRNRQYYRTGVYWCLYINIIAVVGMYYWFYRFTMNFGYLWWLFYFFILTFFLSKFIKISSSLNFKREILNSIKWLGHLIEGLYTITFNFIDIMFRFLFKKGVVLSVLGENFTKLNRLVISIYIYTLNML